MRLNPYSGCEMCDAGLPHETASHCPHCHASWNRSSNSAHCSTCHRTFSAPSVFDKHLLTAGCQNPDGVLYPGGKRKGEPVFSGPSINPYGTEIWHGEGMTEDARQRLNGVPGRS